MMNKRFITPKRTLQKSQNRTLAGLARHCCLLSHQKNKEMLSIW